MRAVGLLAIVLIGAAGCDRFGDHPERFIHVHTGVGDQITVYERDGYLRTQGVVTLDGPDKIAAPVNLTTITCHREDAAPPGYCEVTRAEIMTMKNTGTYLMSREDIYEVKEWTVTRVIAFTEEPCRSTEIRIDIPGNSVIEVTENTPGGSCDGVLEHPVSQPRIARMISGTELETTKDDL
jgi:hypothetical protein